MRKQWVVILAVENLDLKGHRDVKRIIYCKFKPRKKTLRRWMKEYYCDRGWVRKEFALAAEQTEVM